MDRYFAPCDASGLRLAKDCCPLSSFPAITLSSSNQPERHSRHPPASVPRFTATYFNACILPRSLTLMCSGTPLLMHDYRISRTYVTRPLPSTSPGSRHSRPTTFALRRRRPQTEARPWEARKKYKPGQPATFDQRWRKPVLEQRRAKPCSSSARVGMSRVEPS